MVQYPVPSKEQLIKAFTAVAKSDKRQVIEQAWVYIKSRKMDIKKSQKKIVDARQVIEKATKCIRIAEEIMEETVASIKP